MEFELPTDLPGENPRCGRAGTVMHVVAHPHEAP
jgi:hypothetical protein